MVKELPVNFTAEEVRGTLENRKSQFRRVIKPQPTHFHKFGGHQPVPCLDKGKVGPTCAGEMVCPYGLRGGHLWVREAWAVHKYYDGRPANGCGPIPEVAVECREIPDSVRVLPSRAHRSIGEERGKWRSPVHMPRWASRITLEITDVRVERLQEISINDIQAEGVMPDGVVFEPGKRYPVKALDATLVLWKIRWDVLNTKRGYSWESNPWVWVVTFRKV